jgi:N-acetylglutamate synthase-like GNAT family acetyltransferase
MTDIQYSSATSGDLPAIQALLADCRLPTDRIELLGDNCLVAKVDSKLVGMVALEPSEGAGLFRSLAVAPDYRGRSLGRSLCARMVNCSSGRAGCVCVSDRVLLAARH